MTSGRPSPTTVAQYQAQPLPGYRPSRTYPPSVASSRAKSKYQAPPPPSSAPAGWWRSSAGVSGAGTSVGIDRASRGGGRLRGVRYLSPDWIDAAGRALAADDRLGAALVGVTLTGGQVVTGGPDGPVTWHLAISDGKVALAAGPAPRAAGLL